MEEKKNEETVVLTKEEYEDLKRSVKTISYTAMFNAGQQARISQLEERLEHAYDLVELYKIRCKQCIYNKKGIKQIIVETREETVKNIEDKIQELLDQPFEGKTEKQKHQRKGMEEGLRMALEIFKEHYGAEM